MADPNPPSAAQTQTAMEPFFIIGAERSGTTLLRLMLDHHPQIRCRFESDFFVDHLTEDGNDPEHEQLLKDLATDRVARREGFTVRKELGFKAEVREFLLKDAAEVGKPCFGVAVHRRYRHLLSIWPQGRFLNLVRDPRDVSPSVIAMGWAANTWHGTELWVQAQKEVELLETVLESGQILHVKFEDLVCKPEETLQQICSFLGLSFEQVMLSYPDDTTYPAPDASAAERWKHKASERDVQWVEEKAGPWLEKTGYERSSYEAISLSDADRAALRKQNRMGKLRFRAQRFGWFTVLSSAMARKLGMRGLARRLEIRMQEKQEQLLR